MMAKVKTKHVAELLKALGVDSLHGEYSYDDGELTVPGKTDDDIKAAEESLDEAALDAEYKSRELKELRSGSYPPIADQLDAIWKQFNADRLGGKNLVSDADAMLGSILSVKKKYPKN